MPLQPLRLLTPACAPFWRRLGRRVSWRWLRGGLPLCLSWRWIWSLSMCLGLCVLGCLCQLAVLLGQYWALGNASVRSATRGGGRVLWCSVRRACVGSTGRVEVLPVHSRCEIGCVARVRWWCLSLLLVLFVIPLRTFPAGNGARAHGARAKAGAQSFFLSFFLS